MALNRASYRRVPDLYTVGKEIELLDGQIMWLQVMNPFERDEAQHDAAVARSRIMLALKDQPQSDEMTQVRSMYLDEGRESAISRLVESKKAELFLEVMDEMRTDKDEWGERIDLIERNPDLAAVETEAERVFLSELQDSFALEVARRLESSIMVETEELESLDEVALYDRYVDWFLEQRGNSVGMGEYRITEMWYASRACVGVQTDGEWDHSGCEGHQVRVFESKDEVKHLPQALQGLIVGALMELEISEREGKS